MAQPLRCFRPSWWLSSPTCRCSLSAVVVGDFFTPTYPLLLDSKASVGLQIRSKKLRQSNNNRSCVPLQHQLVEVAILGFMSAKVEEYWTLPSRATYCDILIKHATSNASTAAAEPTFSCHAELFVARVQPNRLLN